MLRIIATSGFFLFEGLAGVLARTEAGPDPTSFIAQLGAFAAAAVALVLWQRDTAKLRDRLIQIEEDRGPLFVEIRDVLRHNVEALQSTASAMQAMSESLQRVPKEEEVLRLRDVLEKVEEQLPPPPRRAGEKR